MLRRTITFSVLLAGVCWLGLVADRALRQQALLRERIERAEAAERARLLAQSVRATLARLEETLASQPDDSLTSQRLAPSPGRIVPAALRRPYGQRTADELRALLSSDRVSAFGLPEAALAAGALGETEAKRMVGERLLAGELPVEPEDLPALAELLDLVTDHRVPRLAALLHEVRRVRPLPTLPNFARHLTGDRRVVGWSRAGAARLYYEIPLSRLLSLAGVEDKVSVVSENANGVKVPDVDGLVLTLDDPPAGPPLWVSRTVTWSGVLLALAALIGLTKALSRERRAARRERDFLASVTHELRTPLASLRLLGETLSRGGGQPVEYGALIAEETERLEGLVERSIRASRSDGELKLSTVDIERMLAAVLDLVRPRAERRGLRLESEVEAGLPQALWDEDEVRRSVLNLLDNAIKHGGERIRLRAERRDDRVVVAIDDDGAGIPGRGSRRLFKPFTRGSTRSGGVGLGLHLVERAARMHGGRVDLTVGERGGCAFALVLPLEPPDPPVLPKPPGIA